MARWNFFTPCDLPQSNPPVQIVDTCSFVGCKCKQNILKEYREDHESVCIARSRPSSNYEVACPYFVDGCETFLQRSAVEAHLTKNHRGQSPSKPAMLEEAYNNQLFISAGASIEASEPTTNNQYGDEEEEIEWCAPIVRRVA